MYMNPILPRKYFTPDAEAHPMPDGRLYIYGSNDKSGANYYCSTQYLVYSTDNENLEDWKVHGVSFDNSADRADAGWAPGNILYAPDAICKDGRYYLYLCTQSQTEGVAVSDKPFGPFTDAVQIKDITGIDPAIFVDDDGQAYYLWGQFSLNGARLNPDMRTLEKGSTVHNILTEQEHGFHEGSSLRKINGRYYLVYTDISRGRATCLSYAVADKPLGPYRKGGVIIDNTGCDPQTWNNHGSITEYKGRYFVFYHRSTQNSRYSRRVCVEQININEDGSIDEVPMTSNGASAPINAFDTIDASVACRMSRDVYIHPSEDGEEVVGCTESGRFGSGWAEYRYIDFPSAAEKCTVFSGGSGSIGLMADGKGEIGRGEISEGKCVIRLTEKITGRRVIWLLISGKDIELRNFRFG